jgi:maleate cis-trans isomerase
VSYFTSRGFEVVHVEGLKCKSIIHVASQKYDDLRDAVLRCDAAKPDAILQLGTNLHFCSVAADAERWLASCSRSAVRRWPRLGAGCPHTSIMMRLRIS